MHSNNREAAGWRPDTIQTNNREAAGWRPDTIHTMETQRRQAGGLTQYRQTIERRRAGGPTQYTQWILPKNTSSLQHFITLQGLADLANKRALSPDADLYGRVPRGRC